MIISRLSNLTSSYWLLFGLVVILTLAGAGIWYADAAVDSEAIVSLPCHVSG